MSYFLCLLITAVAAYLLGSLNSAIIVCRIMKRQDIRKFGSKNAGLTNVLRVFGKLPALLTLVLDLAKGVLAVLLARFIVSDVIGILFFNDDLFIGYVAGLFVVLGHVFPIYYGFHGGKGVLTTCAAMLAVDPLTTFIAILIFIAVVAVSKYVSLGSIASAAANPVLTAVIQSLRGFNGVVFNCIFALLFSALIIFMHKSNIKRLLNKEENKLKF